MQVRAYAHRGQLISIVDGKPVGTCVHGRGYTLVSQDYEDYELDADLQTMQEDVSSDSQYENVVRKEK